MPEAREDLTTVDALGMGSDEDRMSSFLEKEDAPPPKPPVVEGDEDRDEQLETTYTKEEEEKAKSLEEQEQQQEQEQEEVPADEVPAEESVSDEDPVYMVTVAGEEMEVPLSELVQGYSRTADYTRKTQTLSDERRAFEAEMAEVRAERERNARLFEQGQQWLESIQPAEPTQAQWEALRASDPAEYAAQLAEHQHRREQVRLVSEERQALQQKEFEDNQKALAAHIKAERDELEKALPEWKDHTIATDEMQAMHETGLQMGYTPDELNQVYDHRAVLTLRKAMLYDRIQAGKPQVVQRARKAPVLKPGAAPSATRKPAPSRLTRAREALKKTGSPKAAEAFFFEALREE